MNYTAPLQDMQFVLNELAGLDDLAHLPGCEEATADTVAAILEEAGKLASGVLAPLNRVSDKAGARWGDTDGGTVAMPEGFGDVYRQFVENGWMGLGHDPEFGGQGLPRVVSAAVREMWKSANHAFALCPMLTDGAIEALELCGSPAQKATYLPKMVAGEWTGTMNITEPQASSDLAAIRTRAEPQTDSSYKIFFRPENLHHLRRTRPRGEHRLPRAGTPAGRTARREGHLAVRRAEVPRQCRWRAGRAQ